MSGYIDAGDISRDMLYRDMSRRTAEKQEEQEKMTNYANTKYKLDDPEQERRESLDEREKEIITREKQYIIRKNEIEQGLNDRTKNLDKKEKILKDKQTVYAVTAVQLDSRAKKIREKEGSHTILSGRQNRNGILQEAYNIVNEQYKMFNDLADNTNNEIHKLNETLAHQQKFIMDAIEELQDKDPMRGQPGEIFYDSMRQKMLFRNSDGKISLLNNDPAEKNIEYLNRAAAQMK